LTGLPLFEEAFAQWVRAAEAIVQSKPFRTVCCRTIAATAVAWFAVFRSFILNRIALDVDGRRAEYWRQDWSGFQD
jgi:hypothetical protein